MRRNRGRRSSDGRSSREWMKTDTISASAARWVLSSSSGSPWKTGASGPSASPKSVCSPEPVSKTTTRAAAAPARSLMPPLPPRPVRHICCGVRLQPVCQAGSERPHSGWAMTGGAGAGSLGVLAECSASRALMLEEHARDLRDQGAGITAHERLRELIREPLGQRHDDHRAGFKEDHSRVVPHPGQLAGLVGDAHVVREIERQAVAYLLARHDIEREVARLRRQDLPGRYQAEQARDVCRGSEVLEAAIARLIVHHLPL